MDDPVVVAVVLTFRRPGLATRSVRSLVDGEGFEPGRVVVVVNGDGGLDDPALETQVVMVRLAHNLGPAGGFAAGLEAAVDRFDADWVYLCEDDICLFDLPAPRIGGLLAAVGDHESRTGSRVGAVASFGRDLDGATGLTSVHPPASTRLERIDVAAWGASLVSRRVVDAGVLPDGELFFGYEDFDFWLRVRAHGFELLLDGATADLLGGRVTGDGRERAFTGARPRDADEPWRAYYQARNFLELRRRYGHAGWTRAHLWKSVRRFHLTNGRGRVALLHGLWDGFRGHLGRRTRYERAVGEL